MRGIFLFCLSAVLAVLIGCDDQPGGAVANGERPLPPDVSFYPLSTPPPPAQPPPMVQSAPPSPYRPSPYSSIGTTTMSTAPTTVDYGQAGTVYISPPYAVNSSPVVTPTVAPSPYYQTQTVPPPPAVVVNPTPAPVTTYSPPPVTAVTTSPMPATTMPGMPIAAGLRLVPAPDVPPGNHPNDAAPSQWFEIVRPGNGPLRIGRVSASCVCVGVRVPNRTIAQGERALIEARVLTKPPRNNLTYVIFVNMQEPEKTTLDADVTITY